MKVLKTKYPGIYQIGKNYYIDFYADGKRHRKVAGPNLLMALEEKTKLKRKDKRGKYHIVERMEKTTFRQLLELYKAEGQAKKYIIQFEPVYLKHFGGRRLSTITRTDLFAFRDKVKTTPKQNGGKEVTDATVNRALAGLRRLFNFAVFRQYLEENPFPKAPKSGLFYPEKKGLRLFFTEDQVVKILVASPPWLRPIILVNYFTGLRQGELLNLRREWIDRPAGVIYLPSTKTLKDPTGRGQMIVMPKILIDLIESLPKKSGYVFYQPNGQPYKQWHVYKAFKKVLKAVGIDSKRYSWKELRHSTASQMHLKGVEVTAIKDQLRHASSKTTENFYIGSDVAYQREQIEKLSSECFRGFLKALKENSEKPVKKEVDFDTLQEAPPIASA
jgi:integrase